MKPFRFLLVVDDDSVIFILLRVREDGQRRHLANT